LLLQGEGSGFVSLSAHHKKQGKSSSCCSSFFLPRALFPKLCEFCANDYFLFLDNAFWPLFKWSDSSLPPRARGDTSAALRPRGSGVPLTPAVESFRGRRRRVFHYCGNRNGRVCDPAHTDRNGLTVRGDDCSTLIPYLVRERGRSRSISTGPWMTI
jgi:hypothetical protein